MFGLPGMTASRRPPKPQSLQEELFLRLKAYEIPDILEDEYNRYNRCALADARNVKEGASSIVFFRGLL